MTWSASASVTARPKTTTLSSEPTASIRPCSALAVGSSPPSYAGQMVWRSVITSRPHGIVDNMMVLMGDGCFFGLVPMGEGYTYGFGAVDAERFEDPLTGTPRPLQAPLRRFWAGRFQSISLPCKVIGSSMSGRLNGLTSSPGIAAELCSLEMRRMPARRIWVRVAAWPWRTPLC